MNSNNEELALAIKDAIKTCSIKEGRFVGMVADYAPQHGFTLEEPQKSILKALCADSNVQEVVSKKGKVPNLDFEIKIILNHITTSRGYQEGLVFDVLKHLLKGTGCKTPSEVVVGNNNPMPPVAATSSHHASTPSQNANPAKHFHTSSSNNPKRITWLNDRRDTICIVLLALYFIGLIGLIITFFIGKKLEAFEWIAGGSLIAFCICRFDVALNKNHSKFWNWTWWICLAVGIIVGILYETSGEGSPKTVDKTEQNLQKNGIANVKVSIANAWLDHNIDDTLAIHCIFTVDNATGRTLDVVCTFQETDGWGWKRMKDLKDKNNEYCDYDGNVAVSYVPIYVEKEKQKINCVLHIPYSELHLNPSKKFLGQEISHALNCMVKVIDSENESKTLDEANLHFAYWYGNSEDID